MEDEQNIFLNRPCTQEEFNKAYSFQMRKNTLLRSAMKNYYLNHSRPNCLTITKSLFPFLRWLPKYDLRANLLADLTSGFTVAVIHIPQGMAYAALGAVHPIVGIYMAIFPVLIYFFMGTSRHISMGTFSVICLMASGPILEYSTNDNLVGSTSSASLNFEGKVVESCSPAQVASVVCSTVGAIQVIMGLCKVGSLSKFLSEPLISGFTTGAAVIVLVSQLQHVFGIETPSHSGLFYVIHTLQDLVRTISKTNYVALGFSLTVIIFLFTFSIILKPRFKCKCQIPIELIVIIVSTTISYFLNLKNGYGVHIIGSIPQGISKPSIPPLWLIPNILADCVGIAVVSFSINISMATLFARKENYKIHANQEFIACGFSNIFGGFFSCLPIASSLSRSMIQYKSGGKTQLASLFSCIVLLTVIFYFGKFLEPLPYCVLAGIVIVCLQSMFTQVSDLPSIWKRSAVDGVIWIASCLSVILLDINLGLLIALILAFFSIIFMNQNIYVCLLGKISNTDMYLEIDRFPTAKPVLNVVIIQIQAGLHFGNIHVTLNKVNSLLNKALANEENKNCKLVIDMPAVLFIDPTAQHVLLSFVEKLESQGITVYLAQCSGQVYDQMKRCDFFTDFSENRLFPTIQDAVMYDSTIAYEKINTTIKVI